MGYVINQQTKWYKSKLIRKEKKVKGWNKKNWKHSLKSIQTEHKKKVVEL